MDKLENETWEEYIFRNNLFVIKYADKEQQVIDDITMPLHTNLNQKHHNEEVYHNRITFGETSYICFIDFIMSELYNLRNKYKMGSYCDSISKVEQMTKEREEDIHRQHWLFKQLAYWENKYTENERDKKERERGKKQEEMNVKNRYFELKTTISESHKEQLDELLAIVRDSSICILEGETKSNMYSREYWCNKEKEKENEKNQKKKERVELFQKYLKNKDIQSQIIELEKKIIQLKSEIV
jgi:hypothetical protein